MSLFLFLAESVKIIVRPYAGFPSADIFVVQTGIYIRYGFYENKREWMDFSVNLCFSLRVQTHAEV
jgi:hypothetical protein